jgi:hypothetical protein
VFTNDAVTVGTGGGVVEDPAGVRVDVPSSAVTEDVTVSVGAGLGKVENEFGTMVFGHPVRIDHTKPLAGLVTLTWDVTGQDVVGAILVRWDESQGVWVPSGEELTIANSHITGQVQEFSIVSWSGWGKTAQWTGEHTGTRAAAPSCSGGLPSWVQGSVDPDETADDALRVCFETDPKDSEVVAVHIVNNRPFAQTVTLAGTSGWAWAWKGEDHSDIPSIVYKTAQAVFDNSTRIVVPPTREITVGIARPTGQIATMVTGTAAINASTVTADLLAIAADSFPIGGTDNPVLSALIQALYECGGRQALAGDFTQLAAVSAVAQALVGCAEEIVRGESEFGTRLEELSRAAIAKGGLTETAAIQANRAARSIASTMKVINFWKLTAYVAEQTANMVVGNLSWSIRGRGVPETLGSWTPSCADVDADSNALFRNIGTQDQFADTSVEFHDFPGWVPAAKVAVKPLTACSIEHRAALAASLPGAWGDPQAATDVASAITALADAVDPDVFPWRITGTGVGPLHLGDLISDYVDIIGAPDDARFCQAVFTTIGAQQLAVSDVSQTLPNPHIATIHIATSGAGTPAAVTDAGVGAGSSVAAVSAAYPLAQWVAPSENEEGYMDEKVIVDLDDGTVTFGAFKGVVTGVIIGTTVFPIEYCG